MQFWCFTIIPKYLNFALFSKDAFSSRSKYANCADYLNLKGLLHSAKGVQFCKALKTSSYKSKICYG